MKRDIVVLGASAGGVEALRDLVAALPAELPAAVLVVLHMSPSGRSALPQILTRAGQLRAAHAIDGEPLEHGRIYVSTPDRHLLLQDDVVRLSRGPSENGYRPAVDALFRSAARSGGPRVLAAVLSGALDDGSAGAQVVVARGGIVLAQDPEDALYPGMPASVLDVVAVQKTGTAREIGLEIALLAGQDVADVALSRDRELELEAGMAGLDPDAISDPQPLGTASGFSCPDCQGGLFELGPGDRQLRFRCRVGHAWTAVSLLAEQDASLEHALWMALRSLEEKAALGRRMASAAETRGSERTAGHYRRSAEEALQATGTLRQLLLAQPAQVGPDLAEPATVPRSGEPDGREELHQQ